MPLIKRIKCRIQIKMARKYRITKACFYNVTLGPLTYTLLPIMVRTSKIRKCDWVKKSPKFSYMLGTQNKIRLEGGYIRLTRNSSDFSSKNRWSALNHLSGHSSIVSSITNSRHMYVYYYNNVRFYWATIKFRNSCCFTNISLKMFKTKSFTEENLFF